MKITQRILSLIVPAAAATSLFMGCGGGDTVQTVNNVTCPEPGEAYCNGTASGVVCAEGSTKGVQFSCAQGEICDDGACVGQCEPDATECVGEQAYRICSPDGKQWVPVACQEGQRCEDGACADIPEPVPPCSDGETRCADEETQQVCDDGEWEDVNCPSGTECSDGACMGECTVGETRCDGTTHDLINTLFSETPPNFTVVWSCKDGTEWTLEPCASDEVCTYDGIDPADAAQYQNDLSSWFMELVITSGDGSLTYPTPPAIPAGATASCVEDPCAEALDWSYTSEPFAFFESPATGVRACGLPDDESPYEKSVQCSGLPPYAPLKLQVTTCPEGTACAPSEPQRGCAVYECAPEETACDGDYLQTCDDEDLEFDATSCTYGCTETDSGASCNPPPEL